MSNRIINLPSFACTVSVEKDKRQKYSCMPDGLRGKIERGYAAFCDKLASQHLLVRYALRACVRLAESARQYSVYYLCCFLIPSLIVEAVYAESNSQNQASASITAQWRQLEKAAQYAFQSDNDDEADKLWNEALKRADENNQVYPGRVDCLRGLALLNEKKGNYAEAERLYELAMRDLEAAAGLKSISFAEYMPDLAWLYLRHGKPAQAEVLFQRVLKIKEECYGKDDGRLIPDLGNYAEFLRMNNRLIEANIVEQRARSIHDKIR